MQFLEPTFVHAAKLAGLTDPDICDPADAIPAAAAYLKSNGAPADWQRALYRYNPADWYPPLVMGWAERYGYGARVVWPVEGGRISAGLRPDRRSPSSRARCFEGKCYPHFHDGIDIAAPIGTPVRAIAAGRVTIAGRMSDGAVVVEIEHSARRLLAVRPPPARPPRPRRPVGLGRRAARLDRSDRQHDRAAPPLRDLRLGRAGRPAARPATHGT